MKRVQESRHALGSDALLTVVVDDNVETAELFQQLWREVQIFETTFSRFLPDSELSYVNQQAGSRVSVSPEFVELVTVSKKLSEQTGGLYNPFVLPKLQAAGYKGSWPTPDRHEPGLDYSNRNVVPAEALEVGKNWVSLPPNSALDFGGIGKGYLLDQLTNLLEGQQVQNYWLSLGGDILCAGTDVHGKPWEVGIQQAEGEQAVATAERPDAGRLAIATSGVTKRKGADWHHIIDPHTGASARTNVLTATVCMPSGTQADVLAKCLVIVGSEEAKNFAKIHKIENFVLQFAGKSAKIEVYKTGKYISA